MNAGDDSIAGGDDKDNGDDEQPEAFQAAKKPGSRLAGRRWSVAVERPPEDHFAFRHVGWFVKVDIEEEDRTEGVGRSVLDFITPGVHKIFALV